MKTRRAVSADRTRSDHTHARSSRSSDRSPHEIEAQRAPERPPDVRIKRVYDKPVRGDGYRVLVDRIWPRGVTRRRAAIDAWARALAPTTALRKWFGHDPKLWSMFQQRYRAELGAHDGELTALRKRAAIQRVTLVYAAKDRRFNHAVVLEEVIRS